MSDDEPTDEPDDVYDAEERDSLEEGDEIETWEEGFMEGAEGDGQQGKCANCGKALTRRQTIEREVGDRVRWFCCDECVDEYLEKKEE